MVSVQSPPGGSELPYGRLLLLPAAVMAAATGAAVAAVAQQARTAVGLCGALATLLVVATAAEAMRRGRELRRVRTESDRRTTYLEGRLAAHDEDLLRVSRELLPEALILVRSGENPTEVLRRLVDCDPAWRHLPLPQRSLLYGVLDVVDREEARRDISQRAFVSVARRVQAIVHQQAKELREMEEDHGRNPEVFDDLLRIDHGTALIGRLADSVSVLGGGRPGRQWPGPVTLYSTLRGSMSRILEYRRIQLDSIAQVNVIGTAVEPVVHAVAELLDNSCRYSPPQTKVHVTAVEVQTGVAIEIEDAGVSFNNEARERVERMLELALDDVDLRNLHEAPRLGLAVVSRICKAYNMQISLRPSAYGGVRAVLVVPSELLTTEPGDGVAHGIGATAFAVKTPDALEGPKRTPKRRRPTSPRIPAGVSMEDEVPVVTEWTAQGLPQRRSRMKIPLAQRFAEQAAAEQAEREARRAAGLPVDEPKTDWGAPLTGPVPDPDEPEPGLWVEAFMNGLKGDPDPAAVAGSATTNEPARPEADDEGKPQ